jgi:predicted RNA polymerase sigma factor
VQDALVAAAGHWPAEGIPDEPRAWLTAVATRRLIDQRRSERSRAERELATALRDVSTEASDRDDSLALLYMCCHPALTPASAIALTLRAVGGLTTAQIAAAFLVPESTMAQRISRAKQRIRESGVSFRMPAPEERDARTRSVLHVLYLLFNEGYATSNAPELLRVDLSTEAIRLARMLHAELPGDPEITGLLALMLLTDARRPGRLDANGEPIPLPEQDRTRWDHARIAEGLALLDDAIAAGRVGEYQLHAAIAAIHDRAPTADATDWAQILALYELLDRMTGNPIVTLNRAVAAAMVHGPATGLEILAEAESRLAAHHRVEAVRAHLLEQAGETDAAARSYRRAAALTTNLAEQRHLTRQAARLAARPSSS